MGVTSPVFHRADNQGPGVVGEGITNVIRSHCAVGSRGEKCGVEPVVGQRHSDGWEAVRRPWTGSEASLSSGLIQEPPMQFGSERMDRASQLRVGLKFQLLFGEIMIGLGLLKS